MKQKTALVAGGSGFIGSHLCDYLIARNYKVICIDNLITGSKPNISHLLKNKNFKFIKHDVTKPFKVNGKINEIYNLASPASPVDFGRLAEEIMLVNSIGTLNLLKLAKKNRAKFLEASTSEVYGEPLVHPQVEEYRGNVSTTGPRACYDESKRFAEALVATYRSKYHLNAKIVRIFNTYGPRMRANDGRVLPNFINQALKGKPITIYGKGNQTRSFCYVSDLVDGIYKMMQSKQSGPINLGNSNEMKIIDVAKLIIKATKSKSKINYVPLPKDDPTRRKPDIAKAKKFLGWNPKVNLKKGLARTIKYFSEGA